MQHPHAPSQESLTFRANLARLISPLRRVRPRVPFFQLAAHRVPTLWSLYRGLLREAPSEEIKQRIRFAFRKNRHLTGTDATKRGLEKGYKVVYLDKFQKANAGDMHQQADLKRYTRAIRANDERAYWLSLAEKERAWQIRLANRPIMTGGLLRPSFANRPLPRLKPQPEHIGGMIRKRRLARERRMQKMAYIQECIQDLELEAMFETGAARLAGKAIESVYASHMEDWMEPFRKQQEMIKETFVRDQRRRDEPYSQEMLDAIKAARREKIANKTRELERERRGEVLRRTILRRRKGPPAHVLALLTPEQRIMDKVVRNVSEVGYVAKIKRRLGFKLRDPNAWKAEIGSPKDKERLDRMVKEVLDESERREKKAHEVVDTQRSLSENTV